MPDGVWFTGGWNYGSARYDAGITGIHVEIVVCDSCIEKAQGTTRMREVNHREKPLDDFTKMVKQAAYEERKLYGKEKETSLENA